ncbi:hypothetical protein IQ07DRAFT_139875 [Pyrenochaeta sp. DS3sAY3a]|nr:hypothetical protein IQ07DRAFT_139875 [Pyrenochaeta sp. DS3sAY3a]
MGVWYSGIDHLQIYADLVEKIGGFCTGAASGSETLNFRSFPPHMRIMNKFLGIMNALREQKLDLVGALRRIYVLFRSYPQVWQGFNRFLPDDYRLTEHGCFFPDGSYVEMVHDEEKGTEHRELSLKDTIPDSVSIRKAICLSDMMIGTLFIKLTISEDRTGQNGSEARARLCALLDDSGVSTGRHLRIVSQLDRKGL